MHFYNYENEIKFLYDKLDTIYRLTNQNNYEDKEDSTSEDIFTKIHYIASS
jgi:hypothetical protein